MTETNTNNFDQAEASLNALIQKQAEHEFAEEQNPYRQAAIRLLTNYAEPSFEQVQHELNNL